MQIHPFLGGWQSPDSGWWVGTDKEGWGVLNKKKALLKDPLLLVVMHVCAWGNTCMVSACCRRLWGGNRTPTRWGNLTNTDPGGRPEMQYQPLHHKIPFRCWSVTESHPPLTPWSPIRRHMILEDSIRQKHDSRSGVLIIFLYPGEGGGGGGGASTQAGPGSTCPQHTTPNSQTECPIGNHKIPFRYWSVTESHPPLTPWSPIRRHMILEDSIRQKHDSRSGVLIIFRATKSHTTR